MQVEGIIAGILASLIWSFNPSIIKRFAGEADPIVLNALRIIFAFLFLSPVVLLTGFHLECTVRGIMFILGSAVIGPGIGDILYIESIKRIGAGKAVTIGYTYVFISQLLAIVFTGEKYTVSLAIGTLTAFIGVYIVYTGDLDEDGVVGVKEGGIRGLLIALGPAVSWGIGSVLNKFALAYTDPISLAYLRSVILALLLVPLSSSKLITYMKNEKILATAVTTGGLGFGVGIPLFLIAIDYVGVSIAVLATTLTPVLGRVLSTLFAGEKLTKRGGLGTALVSSGILLGSMSY